jgi:hypothetical protein
MSFVGNSSSCIKTGVFEGYGYCLIPLSSTLEGVLPPSRQDRYSCHLGLLQLVTRSEYSCRSLHNQGGVVSKKSTRGARIAPKALRAGPLGL